ncbi:MAG: SirB2 family protein [Betaproteobacteria bacterium]|nr:SirB2 family protein [Betaproteobacteria bacterium]
MQAYPLVKLLHVACVALSLAGFAARGALMLADSPLLQARWMRIAPHLVDTVLLASALWLSWALGQYPFVHGWLTVKVLGLLAYIGFGMFALRRGRTRGVRAACFVLALLSAAYVVSVALTRDPAGALAWFQ